MPAVLYKRQKEIMDYISQYIAQHGCSPSFKEIAAAIGVTSLATVFEHIDSLVKKGVLRKYTGTIRGLEIVEENWHPGSGGLNLPILGYIAAGSPIEPYTDPNAYLSVGLNMVSAKKRAYILQVKGDSMIEEGILDGDYVVVEETNTAENGEIVVALLENGLATLKRYFREATRVRLEPANAKMSPIYATNVQIQGRAVGIIRRFHLHS